MTTTMIPTATDAVLEALAQNPDATPAALAEATGLVRSTVSRALVVLEEETKVARRPSSKSGRPGRQPDRWSAIESAPTTVPDTATPATPEVSGDEQVMLPVSAEGRRLGKGELRTLVLGHVCARPSQEMTPSAIAKALGRSPGAVANALVRLATDNEVVELPGSPRRYRAIPR
ncbi:MAG TPA: MarR family transcriptional regulator [Acidimicrobiales bacterium]|nr:MarR family transcriptional regulator [Acidimicrobiales bacterium]